MCSWLVTDSRDVKEGERMRRHHCLTTYVPIMFVPAGGCFLVLQEHQHQWLQSRGPFFTPPLEYSIVARACT